LRQASGPGRSVITPPRGRVIRLQRITRAMVQADRDTIFVFGDNKKRVGYGGQAGRMTAEVSRFGREVIVGQLVPEDRDARYVGLVYTFDPSPNPPVRLAPGVYRPIKMIPS
jgi:hypothetical protein